MGKVTVMAGVGGGDDYCAMRKVGLALGAVMCLGGAGNGLAQGVSVINPPVVTPNNFTTLITPVLSPDFSRDHNIGVLEEAQPDYAAPGAAIGSFVLHPQVTLGGVGDDNVYATQANRQSDVSGVLKPSALLMSDWSRHSLQLQASSDFRRYATQVRRNQNSWDIYPQGQVELGSRVELHGEARFGRYYENPYSNDLNPDAQILSNFFRSGVLVRGTYTGGRVRLSAVYDHSAFDFATLHFRDGSSTDQSYRNRTIDRFSGQGEFALTPSVALYAAVSADTTSYRVALDINSPKQDSTGQNIIGGVSFDLAGVMRGQIGLGYTRRDYRYTGYTNVQALSGQARVDFFPFQTTTVSFSGQRLIQDSSLGSTPYIDTRLMAEVDQSLRENLVVVLNASVANQTYVGVSGKRVGRQVQASVRYQASRWLGFQAEAAYRSSSPTELTLGTEYHGVIAGLSMTVRR